MLGAGVKPRSRPDPDRLTPERKADREGTGSGAHRPYQPSPDRQEGVAYTHLASRKFIVHHHQGTLAA